MSRTLVPALAILAAAASLAVAGPSKPAAAVPATPAGRELAAFLKAYNARELDEERWRRWHSIYGPLELTEVLASTDRELTVWLRGSVTRGWMRLKVILKEEPPHELDGFGVTTGFLPVDALARPSAPLSERQLVQQAGAYLERLAVEDYFSGTVLIARDGKPILSRAFGQASKRHGIPNRVDTRYNIGSITKMFTAVAVAQLVDQGRIRFTDTIAEALPGYANQIADRATIHQLLTHSSGAGRGAFHAEAFTDRRLRSVSDHLAMTIAPQEFEPGTDVRYSNEGFVILGAIIEKASGRDYFELVQRGIYDAAVMRDSGAFEADREVPNLATGYTRWRWKGDREFSFEDGARRSNDFMRALRGNPSCCTYSTAPDLLRFANALLDNKLLAEQTTRTLLGEHVWMPQDPAAEGREGYAYGLELFEADGVLRFGKSGSIDGVSARLDMYPSLGYTVIVLSNYDTIGNLVVPDHLGALVMSTRRREP